MVKQALLVIDVQNDYFPNGQFPLWNTQTVLQNTLTAIAQAQQRHIPVILVQHIVNAPSGTAPFFNRDSEGVQLHPALSQLAPQAPVIIKHYADSFEETKLEVILQSLGITKLLICGMMTQNCVTHTAISKTADKYAVTVVSDCCTTVSEMLHEIALSAIGRRVAVSTWAEALQ